MRKQQGPEWSRISRKVENAKLISVNALTIELDNVITYSGEFRSRPKGFCRSRRLLGNKRIGFKHSAKLWTTQVSRSVHSLAFVRFSHFLVRSCAYTWCSVVASASASTSSGYKIHSTLNEPFFLLPFPPFDLVAVREWYSIRSSLPDFFFLPSSPPL